MNHNEFGEILRENILSFASDRRDRQRQAAAEQRLVRPALRQAPDSTLLILWGCTNELLADGGGNQETLPGAKLLSESQRFNTVLEAVIKEKITNDHKGNGHQELRLSGAEKITNPKKIERIRAGRERSKNFR